MELKDKIAEAALAEILNPTFAMTEQCLAHVDIEYENNLPKIVDIDYNQTNKSAIVYFPVLNEDFYFAIELLVKEQIEINSVNISPFINIHFHPTSEEISADELLQMTTLKPDNI